MGRSGKYSWDTHMLRRIAAMLLALSTIAERSASSSPPLRRMVLWILTLAFSAVQQAVNEEAEAFGFPIDFSAMDRFDANDSVDCLRRLAYGFAGLARIVTHLISHIHEMADEASPTHAAIVSRLDNRLFRLLDALHTPPFWPAPIPET